MRPPGPEWVLSDSILSSTNRTNSELLQSAKRVWPRISSYVRRQFNGEIPADERDRIAVDTWESVLQSVAKTLVRTKAAPRQIFDLDAYLIGAFQHRFIRAVRKEKRRSQIVQAFPPEELSRLAESGGNEWVEAFERGLSVRQIVESMDEWARDVWTSYEYGYPWRDIAARYGITEQQAKMRFRYAILKARDRVVPKSPTSSPDKRRREDDK